MTAIAEGPTPADACAARPCAWCSGPFTPRTTGGRRQLFCTEACRRASEKGMRQWTKGELAAGRVTIAQLQRERCSDLPLPDPHPARLGHHTSRARCPRGVLARGFSRCSYSSRRGIRVPTYGEYQSDRESALRQGNPRSNRQGSVLRDRSKIRVGGCCAAQPKTRLHLDMRQSTRRTRLPMLGDQPRPHRRIWRSVADLLKAGGGDWTIHDIEMEEWQAAERTGLRAWSLPDLRWLRPLKRDLRASAKSRDLVVFGRVSQ